MTRKKGAAAAAPTAILATALAFTVLPSAAQEPPPLPIAAER